MNDFDVDGLLFSFPDGWVVSKYDEWQFYKTKFQSIFDGIKAVDLLALSPDKTLWLIEVKNYRDFKRRKEMSLSDEFIKKVRDTLAALLPAKLNAFEDDEKIIAGKCIKAKKIRICLHLEEPHIRSPLYNQNQESANILQKLKQKMKPIDKSPIVSAVRFGNLVPWSVRFRLN